MDAAAASSVALAAAACAAAIAALRCAMDATRTPLQMLPDPLHNAWQFVQCAEVAPHQPDWEQPASKEEQEQQSG
jgi:hypothetical protein